MKKAKNSLPLHFTTSKISIFLRNFFSSPQLLPEFFNSFPNIEKSSFNFSVYKLSISNQSPEKEMFILKSALDLIFTSEFLYQISTARFENAIFSLCKISAYFLKRSITILTKLLLNDNSLANFFLDLKSLKQPLYSFIPVSLVENSNIFDQVLLLLDSKSAQLYDFETNLPTSYEIKSATFGRYEVKNSEQSLLLFSSRTFLQPISNNQNLASNSLFPRIFSLDCSFLFGLIEILDGDHLLNVFESFLIISSVFDYHLVLVKNLIFHLLNSNITNAFRGNGKHALCLKRFFHVFMFDLFQDLSHTIYSEFPDLDTLKFDENPQQAESVLFYFWDFLIENISSIPSPIKIAFRFLTLFSQTRESIMILFFENFIFPQLNNIELIKYIQLSILTSKPSDLISSFQRFPDLIKKVDEFYQGIWSSTQYAFVHFPKSRIVRSLNVVEAFSKQNVQHRSNISYPFISILEFLFEIRDRVSDSTPLETFFDI